MHESLDSLYSFLIFSILSLEKFVLGFVSSKFYSHSFNDSDFLRALNSQTCHVIFRHAFKAFKAFFLVKFNSFRDRFSIFTL